MSVNENRSFSGNWHGKTRIKYCNMFTALRNLFWLLQPLNLIPKSFDDDWEEAWICYVNRILWSKLDKNERKS